MTSDKSIKKFCNLSKYIKQKEPQLFSVFEDFCLLHYLKPARGSNGITFLLPKEKAYKQKIINAAYSTNPDIAAAMLKALILQDYYPTPSSFNGTVVNLLNQKVEIKDVSEKHVKLSNGLELEKDAKFEPMGRSNMAVYTLSGKGEMPTNGTTVVIDKPAKQTGGSSINGKMALQELLKNTYLQEIGKSDNCYVKKVYLQLKYIKECESDASAELFEYLGNDEFSDSYLLDMYCESKYSKSFEYILRGMASNHQDKTNNITRQKYLALKSEMTANAPAQTEVSQATRTNGIAALMEIRERVVQLYQQDNKRLGKDLFIVFCNVFKDIWINEPDGQESFKSFEFIASRIYTCCTDILNSGFDAARDLTLYGNLLKSDVLLFSPRSITGGGDSTAASGMPIPKSMPSPLDMTLFSLTGYSNYLNTVKGSGMSGGNADSNECLEKMFKDL